MMNVQASSLKDKNEIDNDVLSYEVQRRARLEAQLTAGCGYGRKKQKLVDNFWVIIWPGLEKIGWRKVGHTEKTKNRGTKQSA
jgi:hypothetical protein